jgi:hypothetical protein
MANNVDKDYVRAVLSPAVEMLEPNSFVLNHLFKNTELFATKNVDLDIYRGKRRASPYVRRNQEGVAIDKIGYETRSITPPLLKPKKFIDPDDILKRMPGEQISFQGNSRLSMVDQFLARELNDLDGTITRAEILQACQSLWNGEIVAKDIDGNTLFTLGYGRAANLTYQVSTLWSATGNNPLKDLGEARRRIQTHTGFRADFIYGGFDAIQAFLASTGVQNQLSKDWAARGEFVEELSSLGGVFYGRIAGFDVWGWDETYTDENGVDQYLFPEKKVLVGSSQAECSRVYGAIPHMDSMVAAPRFLNTYKENDPSVDVIQLYSAPVMLAKHADAYAVLTVLT